ncbi:MAG: hypothetical protein OXT09_24585 [Myxococcales bacterium]|nr:hypothetical protein [Myxococcales bacterium]
MKGSSDSRQVWFPVPARWLLGLLLILAVGQGLAACLGPGLEPPGDGNGRTGAGSADESPGGDGDGGDDLTDFGNSDTGSEPMPEPPATGDDMQTSDGVRDADAGVDDEDGGV